MRHSPSHEATGGDGARLPVRRESEASPDGEPLLDHLATRLTAAEHDTRASRAEHAALERRRELLSAITSRLAEHPETPLVEVARLALPELGRWCIVEEVVGDHLERDLVSPDDERREASALVGRAPSPMPPGSALAHASRAGRIQRLNGIPSAIAEGESETVRAAFRALGDGPVLMTPVVARGRLCAVLAFGRATGERSHDDADERFASELAALAALGVSHRHMTAAAEAASRAKTEFLAMMSHELRTPLNAIAGYAQLLEMGFRGALNDAQRDAVNRIIRGQEHLLELVDGVLTFSRLTSGHLPLGDEQVRASRLMELASEPLVKEFASRGIDFRLEQCADDATVHADRERSLQVLRQLLGNALKFTPRGGSVKLRCNFGEGVAHFSVTDTGRGIPAAHHESIFHPFVQVEQGLTRSADGSGLGLAISRELAERMGGTLRVKSENGAGSTFTFSLPADEL